MKPSFYRLWTLAPISTPIFFTKSKIYTRPISYSSISPHPTSLKPKTPLFLKPPTFSTSISELQKWQNWAETLASSIGSTFLESDNGPTSEILKRELLWLLEDVLENPKLNFIGNSDNCTNNGDVLVKMRVELEDLYVLWKQRIEERRPFQYIVGCEHWRDLILSVEEGVLIPRPETEKIVDLVSDLIEGNEMFKEGLWADVGTGSGALAIGIGRILGSNGRVIASDLSHIDVQVASFNVQRYNLQVGDLSFGFVFRFYLRL